jgi:membrane-associated protease RseP (regulator of RpoE activity)
MHELSHKIAASKHGIRASLPYFIPGLPTVLPTFGAFISTRDPPTNRDSLFDLGLSGPIGGLIITLFVGVGGALTSFSTSVDVAENLGTQTVTVDVFTETVLSLFSSQPEGSVLILSPLTFAATIGFLITFLNLMPAWQLDGGHIASSVLSKRQHKVATYISILVLFVLGFTLMALFVLVLSIRTPEASPLDNVSELSRSRRVIFIGVIVLAIALYFFTIANNPFFSNSL